MGRDIPQVTTFTFVGLCKKCRVYAATANNSSLIRQQDLCALVVSYWAREARTQDEMQ